MEQHYVKNDHFNDYSKTLNLEITQNRDDFDSLVYRFNNFVTDQNNTNERHLNKIEGNQNKATNITEILDDYKIKIKDLYTKADSAVHVLSTKTK